MKKIIIAGGCFWGVEYYYSRLKGVLFTKAGYTDGTTENPSYQEVCNSVGHVEAVYVEYDETIISTMQILDHFFRIVDPTQVNQQGPDLGIQYRSALFYYDPLDQTLFLEEIAKRQKNYRLPIQTYVKQATPFFDAEEYHQKYLVKNPSGYCHISLTKAKNEELKEEYRHHER